MGTNSKNPDGNNIPYLAKLNEQLVKVHDNSKVGKQISEAVDYDLVLAGSSVIGVKIKKTKKDHEKEQPKIKKKKTIEERLDAIEKHLRLEV